jgi:hypothetical protein
LAAIFFKGASSVAPGKVNRNRFAIFIAAARANGDNRFLLWLFFGGVWQNQLTIGEGLKDERQIVL